VTAPGRIGKYRILGEIGIGGMAIVHRAHQDALGRDVAIKQLKPDYVREPQVAVRFEREALSIAALAHENIIHIYDFIKEGDEYYMVLEFVEGIDLYDLLDRTQRLPPDPALVIALGLGRALEYAHFRGVIHRDIKPANVILSKRGEVKLMDFGIARDEAFQEMTLTGVGLGTPAYMSPEQTLGGLIDFRSDLFSFGVVCYQMLTGKKPFPADKDEMVMHRIRLEPHEPLRKVVPGIPRALEAIVDRCMEKVPRDRYKNTTDLVRDLEDLAAQRFEENYQTVLMQYLQREGVVDAAESASFLSTTSAAAAAADLVRGNGAGAGGAGAGDDPGAGRIGRRRPPARPALAVGILAAVAIGAAGIGLGGGWLIGGGAGGLGGGGGAAYAGRTADEVGWLKVVVHPWGEVYVDGAYVDTTPIGGRIALGAGPHVVEVVHPSARATRDVTIAAGETESLKIDLDAPSATKSGAVDPK